MWIPISLLLQFCYGYNMLHNRYMFSSVKNLMDRCENLMKWHYFELVIPDLQYKITTETEFGRNFVVKKARETVSVLMIITPLVIKYVYFSSWCKIKDELCSFVSQYSRFCWSQCFNCNAASLCQTMKTSSIAALRLKRGNQHQKWLYSETNKESSSPNSPCVLFFFFNQVFKLKLVTGCNVAFYC